MTEMARFVRGPETTLLVNELQKLRPGDFISETALSAAVGFDVTKYEGHVARARAIILREGGGVIDVAEHGWRRLTDSEAVNFAAPRYTKKARNATARGTHSLTSVEYDSLKDPDKVAHNAGLSILGALRLALSPKARREVTAAVRSANAAIPSAETMRLFEKVK